MSMIAKNSGGINVAKLESGVYTAISSAIVDIGYQESEQFKKVQRKFILIWNIVGEEVEINGEKLPRIISKEYSYSLHEKSTLRKDLQAWRNKVFTEEELEGFNLVNILNKACQMQIILEEKNNNKYNNIASIMALAKGQVAKSLNETEVFHFDIEDKETWTNWGKVPEWIQKKIKEARNYESSNLKQYVEQYEKEKEETTKDTAPLAPVDDLPF